MGLKHVILAILLSMHVLGVIGHACFGNRMKACKNGQCIASEFFCNGENDCGDWSDEFDCVSQKDEESKCPINTFPCNTGHQGHCIPLSWLCDGMNDCPGGRDELNCSSKAECKNGWKCGSECVATSWVCDGIKDCLDGSDEKDCGQFKESKKLEAAFVSPEGNGTVFNRQAEKLVPHLVQALQAFQDTLKQLFEVTSNPCLPNPCNNGFCSMKSLTSYACYCPLGYFVASSEPFRCQLVEEV